METKKLETAFRNFKAMDNENSPQRGASTTGDAASTRTVSIEGEYVAIGKNADGSTYSGTATITSKGDYYRIVWLIEGERIHALSYQEGNSLRCDEWSVVYDIKENGTLDGKWANTGSEKLMPKHSSARNRGSQELTLTIAVPILFLAAEPTDAARLRLGEELREIHEKLQLAKLREYFKLEERMSIRPQDISQALLDVAPQIVHFSGHGTSSGALCFENEVGESQAVQPDALAALFEQFASQVKCVILNACYSAVQANAIAKHINYVIGMDQAIGDAAAIAFTIGVYQALGAGRTIEDAYKLGCVQISLQGIPEQRTPVLIKKGEV